MALFGTQRDISMFRHVSRELMGDIITQQVGYYTLKLDQSTTNMYGEALNKYYNGPLLLIIWYENYYEVDSVTENQLFSGKNAEYPYLSLGDFGRSISLICQTHLVPSDKVQITKERGS